ncbi:hypothetical protein Btru_040785 [Bulinus truncatus]|nr:hypothetical protein Btru_040785 [Bulinus truncatus]
MRPPATMLGIALLLLLTSLIPTSLCDLQAEQQTALLQSVQLDHVTEPATPSDVIIEPRPTAAATRKVPYQAPVKPAINITAIFEEEDVDDFLPEFDKVLQGLAAQNGSAFWWTGQVLVAQRDVRKMMTTLCSHFQGDKSHVRLILVFGRKMTIQTVNIVSETLGIPVLGYVINKGDGHMQTIMTPTKERLTDTSGQSTDVPGSAISERGGTGKGRGNVSTLSTSYLCPALCHMTGVDLSYA